VSGLTRTGLPFGVFNFSLQINMVHMPTSYYSFMPIPHLSQGNWSGEPSRISWAYYWNVVRPMRLQYTLHSQAAIIANIPQR